MIFNHDNISFQALSENNAKWIPVQSVAVENKSIAVGNRKMELQPKNQSTINKIYIVEKALKIGVPLLFALFTGSFFAVGFYLKKWGKCQMFFLMFLLIILSNKIVILILGFFVVFYGQDDRVTIVKLLFLFTFMIARQLLFVF